MPSEMSRSEQHDSDLEKLREFLLADQQLDSSSTATNSSRFRDSHQLSKIMASILKLLDDHATSVRLEGMHFLMVYLEIIPVALLRKYGYLNVLFSTFLRILSFKDVDLLNAGFPCIIRVLSLDAIEDPETSATLSTKLDFARLPKDDELILQTMNQIDLFADHKSKFCLVTNLILLIKFMKLSASKFLPRILLIADSLADSFSLDLHISCLQLLTSSCEEFALVCSNHLEQIILMVMKVILLRRTPLKESDQLMQLSKEILSQLEVLDAEAVRNLIKTINQQQFVDCHFVENMNCLLKLSQTN